LYFSLFQEKYLYFQIKSCNKSNKGWPSYLEPSWFYSAGRLFLFPLRVKEPDAHLSALPACVLGSSYSLNLPYLFRTAFFFCKPCVEAVRHDYHKTGVYLF
jgi:hypothetical protein